MSEALHPAVEGWLRQSREPLNAAFEAARARWPALSGPAALDWLRLDVADAVAAVAARDPVAASRVGQTLYALGLNLLGQQLIGPEGRSPGIPEALRLLVRHAPELLATAPARLAGAYGNAAHHLGQHRGARLGDWQSRLGRALPLCAEVDTALDAGLVAAWLSGLPQYRESALARAARLPTGLLAALLDTAPEPALLDKLAADPWFQPGPPPLPLAAVRARVGDFRGLGGEFLQPPVVVGDGQTVHAVSPGWVGQLAADAWGAQLIAVLPTTLPAPAHAVPPGYRLTPAALHTPDGSRLELGRFGPVTGIAWTAQLLALSFRDSHRVRVLARRRDA